MRENFVELSADERENIRLRKKAGETMRAIADDYGISRERVKSITLSPETKAKHAARRLARYRRAEYGSPEAWAKLRAEMVARYEKATGRNLLADLLDGFDDNRARQRSSATSHGSRALSGLRPHTA